MGIREKGKVGIMGGIYGWVFSGSSGRDKLGDSIGGGGFG